MTDFSAQDQVELKGSFWTKLAARAVAFRVIGVPRDATGEVRFGHLSLVYCSKEVLGLLAIIFLVLGGIPTAFLLLYHPPLIWVTLSIGLAPAVVTALTVGVIFLQAAAAELMQRGEKPLWISNFVSTFLAVLLAISGFFMWVEFSNRGVLWAMISETPGDIVPWIFGAAVYACIAEVVTMFVLRFLVPTDSDRFAELGHSVPDATSLMADSKVSIGEISFEFATLISVEAQGNYTRVISTDGDVTARQTFSSVVGLLPEAIGLQVHRSRWVAYNGIKEAVSNGQSGLLVTTINGTSLTVAQSRLADVTDLLRRYQANSGRKILRGGASKC